MHWHHILKMIYEWNVEFNAKFLYRKKEAKKKRKKEKKRKKR